MTQFPLWDYYTNRNKLTVTTSQKLQNLNYTLACDYAIQKSANILLIKQPLNCIKFLNSQCRILRRRRRLRIIGNTLKRTVLMMLMMLVNFFLSKSFAFIFFCLTHLSSSFFFVSIVLSDSVEMESVAALKSFFKISYFIIRL